MIIYNFFDKGYEAKGEIEESGGFYRAYIPQNKEIDFYKSHSLGELLNAIIKMGFEIVKIEYFDYKIKKRKDDPYTSFLLSTCDLGDFDNSGGFHPLIGKCF